MKTMKKVAEVCEPQALTNNAAATHLLAQIEWWYWIVAVIAIYVIGLLFWRSAKETGFQLGKLAGSGALRDLVTNGRYHMIEIPKDTLIRILLDIDSGISHFYAIHAKTVHGGAERVHAAHTFQVLETHGGDLIQLAELEVVPEPEIPPTRRQRLAAWAREKTSRPIVLNKVAS